MARKFCRKGKRGAYRSGLWISASAGLLHASCAFAQDSAAPPNTDTSANSGEIVVTAAKTGAQSIQKIPLNISAVGADQLGKSSATSVDDVMRQIPGVNVNGGAGNKTIVIRGLASTAGTAMVGMYLDEILLPSAGTAGVAQTDPALFDMSRVEVLRGPQGTLYGAGSMGGTVRYITNAPDTSKVDGAVNVMAGARAAGGGGKYQGDIMINLPIIPDQLALRVVAWQRYVDGFVTNTGLDKHGTDKENSQGVRAELLYTPGPNTKITGTFTYQNLHLDDTSHVFVGGDYRTNPVLEPFTDRLWASNITIEQDVGLGKVTATGSHVLRHSVLNLDQSEFLPGDPANLAVFLPSKYDSYDLQYGVINRVGTVQDNIGELRFASDFKIPVQISTGLFYDQTISRSDIYGWYVDPGTGLPYGSIPPWYQTSDRAENSNKAIFIDGTWSINDKISVEGGIRYYDLHQEGLTYIANPFFGTDVGYQPYQSSSQKGTVKKAEMTYKPNSAVLTYFVYSQGFRQGGANTKFPGTSGIPASYAPDYVTNFELGWKTQIADRQIVFNGAIYHMNWSNIQVTDEDSTGAYTFITNGSKARFDGVELEMRMKPRALPGFSAGLTGRYSEQKLTEDNPAVTTYAGVKGEQIPYSNKAGASASVNQDFTVRGMPAYVSGDVTYTGRGYTEFDKSDPAYRPIGNYTILNIKAGIEKMHWHAALYAKNLNNARGFTTWRVESLAGIPDRVDVTPPREVGIELGWKM